MVNNGTNGTSKKRESFLNALREKGSVYHAAKSINVGRRTVYTWRKQLPGFAKEWDAAIEDAADELEASLYERGMTKDTTAAIFWLKGHRPEKYRERLQHDVNIRQEAERVARELGLDVEAVIAEAERIARG